MIAALDRLLGLLFPSRCVGCGLRGVDLCPTCMAAIRPPDPSSCPRCGAHSKLGSLCPACRSYQGPLAGIRSACIYEGVARRAIHAFKYRHRQTLARPLALVLAREMGRRPLDLDMLVPVPLHPRRLAERGYNQSGLLARELADLLGCMNLDLLERHKRTAPQAGLQAADRKANVRGAFRCKDGVDLSGHRIGLVDDVCTTGATMEDCARALREAGAAIVWGIALARDL